MKLGLHTMYRGACIVCKLVGSICCRFLQVGGRSRRHNLSYRFSDLRRVVLHVSFTLIDKLLYHVVSNFSSSQAKEQRLANSRTVIFHLH